MKIFDRRTIGTFILCVTPLSASSSKASDPAEADFTLSFADEFSLLQPDQQSASKRVLDQLDDHLSRSAIEKLRFSVAAGKSVRRADTRLRELSMRIRIQQPTWIEVPDEGFIDGDDQTRAQARFELRIRHGGNTVDQQFVLTVDDTTPARLAFEEISVPYQDKPWVRNLDEYIDEHPEGQFVVYRSSQLWDTPDQAVRDAVSQRLNDSRLPPADQNILLESLSSGLVDQFVRRVERPYAKLYHAHVMLDLNRSPIQQAERTIQQRRNHRVHEARSRASIKWVTKFIGLPLVAGLLGLGYLVLNRRTRGYYEQTLRVGTVTAAVGVTLAALGCLDAF